MLAHGNSDVRTCVLNLSATIRGEVPMSRLKGIGRSLIDMPVTKAKGAYFEDLRTQVAIYDRRAVLDDVAMQGGPEDVGTFLASLKLTGKEDNGE